MTHTPVLKQVITRTQLGFLWNTCSIIKSCCLSAVTTRSTVATIRPVQILTTIRPKDRYLPLWHFNLCPVRQYVFRSNTNNSVINSAKHNFVYLTTDHIRYLVSNQGSPVIACRYNFTFCNTRQFNRANFCCAVCHNLCYSYSQSVATFSAIIAPTIKRTISLSYYTETFGVFVRPCSFIFTYC
jgi:hypothetical protein